MARCKYEVVVGNVGQVYCGNSKKKAIETFTDYEAISKYATGSRASEEEVTLFENHRNGTDIIKEYIPESKFDEYE
jgi:hypothetical protein